MAKNWENSPWKWVTVVVIATVIGGVTTAAVQKWWGLKLAEQQRVIQSTTLGKYQAV